MSARIGRQELNDFLALHRLPRQFVELIDGPYGELAHSVNEHHKSAQRPLVVGINGSQGSGKSTLASLLRLLLSHVFRLKVADLSIDDFYLTRQERLSLAEQVHPLLITRGVPGTHDVPLMQEVLGQLIRAKGEVRIPRFNKALDDRFPQDIWESLIAPLDVVILEGWCLGTPPENDTQLQVAVNELERREDPTAVWRGYVNQQIEEQYQGIYHMVDLWVMLQAPSFDSVFRWRLEQEQKLARKIASAGMDAEGENRVMSEEQLARFIQHYQRLTQHTLQVLPARVHYLFRLNDEREITMAGKPQQVEL